MSNQDLAAAVREFQEYRQIKEQAEAALKAIQARIIAHMEQEEVAEITVGVVKVTYKPVTSIRLDSNALKTANPDMYARFSTASTSMRFVVR